MNEHDTVYLVRGARLLGGDPVDLLLRDGVVAAVGPRTRRSTATTSRSTPPAWSRCPAWSTCTRTCASPAARTPRRSRPARGPRRSAASPPCTRWPTPTRSPTPPASSSRSGGSAARPAYCDVQPVGAVTVGLRGRAARRARRDGRLRGAGAGVLRRRQVRLRRGADAPGAGVRQGVRRRHRPARAGAAADRGRADERGRALRRARPARLARRRRGGDHRPRRAARRARRLAAARLPRVDRRLGRDHPLGQGARLDVTAEVTPAPPAAHRRARRRLRPDLQGQPAAAHRGRRRGAARARSPTAPSTPSPPTTPRTRSRTRTASGRPRRSACSASRPRCRVVQEAMVDTGLLDWAGVADRMSVRPARIGRLAGHGRPLEVGEPANLDARRPDGRHGRRPGRRWRQPQPQHPVRRARAAGAGGRDVPARPADRARRVRSSRSARRAGELRCRAGGRARARGRPHASAARRYGARRRDVRRGGVLHRHDRLPGDADRPVATTGQVVVHDRAAHRQHRRQRRGRRVPAGSGSPATSCATPARVASAAGAPSAPSTTSSSRRASSASAGSTPAR